MANRSKEKGDRFERQVVDRFTQIPGVTANRTGLAIQSSRPEEKPGDVVAVISQPGDSINLKVECKSREGNAGWVQIVKWLEGCDVLALKKEGSMFPIVVINWNLFEDMIRAITRNTNTGKPQEETVDLLEGRGIGEWNPNTKQLDQAYHEGHGD